MNRELMARQMFANGGVAKMEEGGEPSAYELSPEEIRLLKDQLYDMESGRVLESDRQKLFDVLEKLKGRERLEDRVRRFLESVPVYPKNTGDYVESQTPSENYRDMAPGRPFITPQERMPIIPAAPFLTPREQGNPEDMIRLLRMQEQINAYPGRMSQQEMQTIKDRNYAYGGPVYKMQEGGVPPVNPMAGMPVSPDAAMPPMAGAAGVDPAMMEQMLMQAQQGITALDDAESAEEVMNAMRGDQATIEERRMELAQIVGEGDAQSTPESVLTLVQPVMMMAQVDQGIGGLAQDQMNQEVTGDMAGGIMSTVNMGAEEGPAPVNFKYGGVVGMQEGGDPLIASYEKRLPLYQQIAGIDAAEQQRQSDLDKAQMLFAIAQGGLQLAGPTDRKMSTAEKLALSGQSVLENISGITSEAAKRKAAERATMQQAKFSALQSAEAEQTARAKAESELALQNLRAAQELAKIETQAVLDTNRESLLEGLKQSGRIEIKNIEGAQSMDLEQLRQSGAIELEDYRQINRLAMEDAQNENRVAIEKLRQSGTKSDLVLANKLEQDNIRLRGEIRLSEMGVANEYELGRMDKAHEQALAINDTNNALKERLAALDRAIDQGRLDLEGEKLDLERAAARLTTLGSSTDARITTLLSDTERLAAYGAGLLDKDETLMMNQAIAYYNAPKSVWSEEKKAFVIVPGNPLSKELLSVIDLRKQNGLVTPNIEVDGQSRGSSISGGVSVSGAEEGAAGGIQSSIMAGIDDPEAAFGSAAAFKNVFNTLSEMFLFSAPFKVEKEAIAGAEALNTKFVQVFQRSAELRDSVMQLSMLKDLTPTPKSLFMGPDAAGAKVTRIIGMIDEAEQALRTKLEDPNSPLSPAQVSEANGYLVDLGQLRAGYNVFRDAYDMGYRKKENVEALREELGLGKRKGK